MSAARARPTSRASLAVLRARGVSQAQIARELGVSDRMVRHVTTGAKPGAPYRDALAQLVSRGRVATPPLRRTTRGGELAKVRAPRGAGVKSVSPIPRRVAPPPRAGRFGVGAREPRPGGGFVQTVTAPKSEGVGRERARQAILAILDDCEPADRPVAFVVYSADGARATVGGTGGYPADVAARRMRAEADDPFAWLVDQMAGRNVDSDSPIGRGPIVRVTIQTL